MTERTLKKRLMAWPDIPASCPQCGDGFIQEQMVSSMNDGMRIIEYMCGTTYCSHMGEPWTTMKITSRCSEIRQHWLDYDGDMYE
jgi:hypothetical protein